MIGTCARQPACMPPAGGRDMQENPSHVACAWSLPFSHFCLPVLYLFVSLGSSFISPFYLPLVYLFFNRAAWAASIVTVLQTRVISLFLKINARSAQECLSALQTLRMRDAGEPKGLGELP